MTWEREGALDRRRESVGFADSSAVRTLRALVSLPDISIKIKNTPEGVFLF